MPKTCLNCRFSVSIDEGPSNYSVEGTTFVCAKRLHPDGPFDEFYGGDKRLEFAEKCDGFQEGEGVHMDAEGVAEAYLTPDQREVWMMHSAASI